MRKQFSGKFSFDEALARARKYCALQERCSSEVNQKLQDWCDDIKENHEIISRLKAENFLSDQRFVELFVRSKINQNRWGRIKIEFELQKRFIPSEIITVALNNIDENQYLENFRYLKLKKEKETSENNAFKSEMKIKAYLATKGFEYEYINKHFK